MLGLGKIKISTEDILIKEKDYLIEGHEPHSKV